jgi:hypothetical protein
MKLLKPAIILITILMLQLGCSKEEPVQPNESNNSNGSGQPSPYPFKDIYKINDIDFVDNNIGYLSGTFILDYNRGWSPSSSYLRFNPVVFKTVDGGISWERIAKFTPFSDNNNYFGISIISTTSNKVLFFSREHFDYISTYNSAGSWSNIFDYPWPSGTPNYWPGIGPSAANIDNTTILFDRYISRDGGNNFQFINSFPQETSVSSYSFADTTYGVYATINGLICKTNDLMSTWDTLYNDPNYYFNNVHLTNNNNIFAGSNGEIIRSIDAGLTWNTVYSDPSAIIKEIEFLDNQVGYAVTRTGISGEVLKTIDGGASWVTDFSCDSIGFNCLKIIDQNYYIASGESDTNYGEISFVRRSIN